MSERIKILVVEDEMLVAANISLQLIELGYDVTAIIPRGEEALLHLKEVRPDIVLLDIILNGELNGIQTAEKIKELYDIPIIFLTANSDDHHFNLAKATKPQAFISKPFKKLDLQRALELTVNLIDDEGPNSRFNGTREQANTVLTDRIYVKHKESMVKVMIKDILYVEAQRNYCNIFTESEEYLLVVPMKKLERDLSSAQFQRTHRSYLVNVLRIDKVASDYVVLAGRTVPVSDSAKDALMQRLKMI